jgi:hypothetical protein
LSSSGARQPTVPNPTIDAVFTEDTIDDDASDEAMLLLLRWLGSSAVAPA